MKKEKTDIAICFLGAYADARGMKKEFGAIEPLWKDAMKRVGNRIIDDLSNRGLIRKPVN